MRLVGQDAQRQDKQPDPGGVQKTPVDEDHQGAALQLAEKTEEEFLRYLNSLPKGQDLPDSHNHEVPSGKYLTSSSPAICRRRLPGQGHEHARSSSGSGRGRSSKNFRTELLSTEQPNLSSRKGSLKAGLDHLEDLCHLMEGLTKSNRALDKDARICLIRGRCSCCAQSHPFEAATAKKVESEDVVKSTVLSKIASYEEEQRLRYSEELGTGDRDIINSSSYTSVRTRYPHQSHPHPPKRILSAAVAKQFPESLAAEDSRLAIPAGPSQALSTVLSMTSSSSSVDSRELPFDFFYLEAAAGSTAGVESPLIRRSSSFTQLRSHRNSLLGLFSATNSTRCQSAGSLSPTATSRPDSKVTNNATSILKPTSSSSNKLDGHQQLEQNLQSCQRRTAPFYAHMQVVPAETQEVPPPDIEEGPHQPQSKWHQPQHGKQQQQHQQQHSPKTAWGKVKNMIYTRKDSLKRSKKRTSSAAPTAGQHHQPFEDVSFNKRSSSNEGGVAQYVLKYSPQLRHKPQQQQQQQQQPHQPQGGFPAPNQTAPSASSSPNQRPSRKSAQSAAGSGVRMRKASEPLSDHDSNSNSPIFGRKSMVDYYHEWISADLGPVGYANPDYAGKGGSLEDCLMEDNHVRCIDPSGVWMGPPEKLPGNRELLPCWSPQVSPKMTGSSGPKRNSSSAISLKDEEQQPLQQQGGMGSSSPLFAPKGVSTPKGTDNKQLLALESPSSSTSPETVHRQRSFESSSSLLSTPKTPRLIRTQWHVVSKGQEAEDPAKVQQQQQQQQQATLVQQQCDSKWSKVKRAFLPTTPTSGQGLPCKAEGCSGCCQGQDGREHFSVENTTVSPPRSPLRNCGNATAFSFDDLQHGGGLGGQWQEATATSWQAGARYPEVPPVQALSPSLASKEDEDVQAEILRNYKQLQRSLSQEFHNKMEQWGMAKVDQCQQAASTGMLLNSSNSPVTLRSSGNCGSSLTSNACAEMATAADPMSDPKLPPEFRRKYQEWQKIKAGCDLAHQGGSATNRRSASQLQTSSSTQALGLLEAPPSEGVAARPTSEIYLSPEFRRRLKNWDKIREKRGGRASTEEPTSLSPLSSPALKPKKIRARPLGQQAVKEDDLKPEFRMKVAEWELIKAMAGNSSKNVEDIRKLMPEEFNRKLMEWELIKESGTAARTDAASGEAKSLQVNQRRKSSSSSSSLGTRQKNSKKRQNSFDKYPGKLVNFESSSAKAKSIPGALERDSAWFDKELRKIHREKERLEREKAKFEEREEKLEQLKHALTLKRPDDDKDSIGATFNAAGLHRLQETVTVKTAKGEEFKFAGISETFTRRLFEWEKQKGIGPELSTMALLNPTGPPQVIQRHGMAKVLLLDDGHRRQTEAAGDSAGPSQEACKGQDRRGSTVKSDAGTLKRCRSEGSLNSGGGETGPKGLNVNVCSMSGGSEGNLSSEAPHPHPAFDNDTSVGSSRPVAANSSDSVSPEMGGTLERTCTDGRKRLARSESLRTKASIHMLDEKMSMIGSLHSHLSHCRQIQSTLENLGDQVRGLEKSKIRLLSEVTEDRSSGHCRAFSSRSTRSNAREGAQTIGQEVEDMRSPDQGLDLKEVPPDEAEATEKELLLNSLLVEQTKLQEHQAILQERVTLEEASAEHSRMTRDLIRRLDSFIHEEIGQTSGSRQSLCEVPVAGESAPKCRRSSRSVIGRIHRLAELLADQTRLLEHSLAEKVAEGSGSVRKTCDRVRGTDTFDDTVIIASSRSSSTSRSSSSNRSSSGNCSSISSAMINSCSAELSPNLFTICRHLRREMVALMKMQSKNEDELQLLKVGVEVSRTARSLDRDQARHSIVARTPMIKASCHSESDISSLCGKFIDTENDALSRLSSSNSMIRYGSESPPHALLFQEDLEGILLDGSQRNLGGIDADVILEQSSRSSSSSLEDNGRAGMGGHDGDNPDRGDSDGDDEDDDGDKFDKGCSSAFGPAHHKKPGSNIHGHQSQNKVNECRDESEDSEYAEAAINDFSTTTQNVLTVSTATAATTTTTSMSDDRSKTSRRSGGNKARRTSSENISTPNSGRSRSPSLISSEFILEEDEDIELVPDPIDKERDRRETISIERLFKLVDVLKEEDLNNYKQKILAKKRVQEEAEAAAASAADSAAAAAAAAADSATACSVSEMAAGEATSSSQPKFSLEQILVRTTPVLIQPMEDGDSSFVKFVNLATLTPEPTTVHHGGHPTADPKYCNLSSNNDSVDSDDLICPLVAPATPGEGPHGDAKTARLEPPTLLEGHHHDRSLMFEYDQSCGDEVTFYEPPRPPSTSKDSEEDGLEDCDRRGSASKQPRQTSQRLECLDPPPTSGSAVNLRRHHLTNADMGSMEGSSSSCKVKASRPKSLIGLFDAKGSSCRKRVLNLPKRLSEPHKPVSPSVCPEAFSPKAEEKAKSRHKTMFHKVLPIKGFMLGLASGGRSAAKEPHPVPNLKSPTSRSTPPGIGAQVGDPHGPASVLAPSILLLPPSEELGASSPKVLNEPPTTALQLDDDDGASVRRWSESRAQQLKMAKAQFLVGSASQIEGSEKSSPTIMDSNARVAGAWDAFLRTPTARSFARTGPDDNRRSMVITPGLDQSNVQVEVRNEDATGKEPSITATNQHSQSCPSSPQLVRNNQGASALKSDKC